MAGRWAASSLVRRRGSVSCPGRRRTRGCRPFIATHMCEDLCLGFPSEGRPATVHSAELAQTDQAKRGPTNEGRTQFDLMYAQHRRDPGIVHIISLLGGIFGLVRCYLNKTGPGYGKLC